MKFSQETNIAITWPGGGSRGIFQFGAAWRLSETGIKPCVTIASSVGSLNGAFFASGQIQRLKELWLTVRNRDVYRLTPWKLPTSQACIFDSSPLRKTIAQNLDCIKLANSKIPLWVNMTDTKTYAGKAVLINELGLSQMIDTLMASAAVPLAFPPINGMIDAGVVNNYGIEQAVDDGADVIIACIPSTPAPKNIRNAIDMLELLLTLPEYSKLQAGLTYAKKMGRKVIEIAPRAPLPFGMLDFNGLGDRTERMHYINDGYVAADFALKGANV